MGPSNDHLKAVEFHALVDGCSPSAEPMPPKDLALLRAHVKGCKDCAETLDAYQRAQDLLMSLDAGMDAEVTPDEAEMIDSLASSRPDWQQDVAAKMRRPRRWNPAWIPAAAAAAVLMVSLTALYYWRWAHSASRLLADAYAERRTLEVRIPGAHYGPVRVERGAAANATTPASLLEAEADIIRQLARNPDDAEWLEAQARADLLHSDYASAIRDANRALQIRPDW